MMSPAVGDFPVKVHATQRHHARVDHHVFLHNGNIGCAGANQNQGLLRALSNSSLICSHPPLFQLRDALPLWLISSILRVG